MNEDQAFNKKIKDTLDKSVDDLDPAIVKRLQQARIKATEQLASKRSSLFTQSISALAMAAVVVIAIVIWPESQNDELITPLMSDIELLAAEDNIQIYEELEFYQWLVESESEAG